MASFNFPTSPANGDEYTLNGITYAYNSVKTRWEILPTVLEVGVDVQAYDAANALTSDITYETLNTNGDVGTGAGQLAIGDHTHEGVYEPADATILKDADIGTTVQAHSAVLDATTASFTTADESKLDGIESGATADQVWGEIGGTLANQTDLQNALDGKSATSHNHSGVYEPADATILKSAAIGVTVQGYDAETPTVAASQAEMEAGTETAIRSMSPLRVKQAIDALGGGGGGGDTGWVSVTLSSPWTNNGGGYATAAYRVIGDIVHIKGLITGGSASSTAFTLPSPIVPVNNQIKTISAYSSGAPALALAYYRNASSGSDLYVQFSGSVSWVSIDCEFILD